MQLKVKAQASAHGGCVLLKTDLTSEHGPKARQLTTYRLTQEQAEALADQLDQAIDECERRQKEEDR
ncbi:hypothetical protein EP30_05375 [Bifidobacterium sp. UTCIF-39]|uniref:hypothetical protein n=1 Tax=Bifidobacterium sp. UTCIF-39 TaxID=1465359 RepID=UPI0011283D5D|nr:hypothetical protein [Bifidobacterium sp. UTCIF-39]TPF96849.1 hypothetical protein EP30_05375 [Bifidobacterium sp. UTCIF-39]